MNEIEEIINNFGILTSIAWNSNNWNTDPTAEDLKKSKYDYVKDNAHMHESLNFGHEIYPVENDGYYIGYTPMFNRPPDIQNSKNVEIVFFTSSDYKNNNQKCIVGFYGHPQFGEWFYRSEIPEYEVYDAGNIKALPENIIYFKNPVIINSTTVEVDNLLPNDKKISQQGFNYLNSDNVYNILVLASHKNPNSKRLKRFIENFPLMLTLTHEEINFRAFTEVVGKIIPDTFENIRELENRMQNYKPEVKTRVSKYIERGKIAQDAKKLANYECLICISLNKQTNSFVKPNGNIYIETHHVNEVHKLQVGSLSLNNLITVCANHHRQLHYGNCTLETFDENTFKFKIDKETITVKKKTSANSGLSQLGF